MNPSRSQSTVCPVSGQSRLEDLANSITHGVGLVLGVGGVATLIALAAVYGSAREIAAISIYGASLLLVYASSTVYHGLRHVRRKQVFQVVDHAAIFLLIAGTYTPFTLVPLHGPWGWSLFGVVWGLAAVGVTVKVIFGDRWEVTSTAVYVAMGWLVLVGVGPLWDSLPVGGWVWLAAGGVVYTVGAAFYLLKRIPFGHTVWHAFVLAGSVCHYVAVLRYVVFAS